MLWKRAMYIAAAVVLMGMTLLLYSADQQPVVVQSRTWQDVEAPPQQSHDKTIVRRRKDRRTATTGSLSFHPSTHHGALTKLWSAGGVASFTEEAALDQLAQIFREALPYRDAFRSAICQSVSGASIQVEPQPHSSTPSPELEVFQKWFLATSRRLAQQDAAIVDDDCRHRLTPHHRTICIAVALIDGEADDVALHERRSFRSTLCNRLAACADWSRGRFDVTLSPAMLKATFEQLSPSSALSTHAEAYVSQFLHHGSEELPYLLARSQAIEAEQDKRLAIYQFHEPPAPPPAGRRHRNLSPRRPVSSNLSSWYTGTNVAPIFRNTAAPLDSHAFIQLLHYSPLQILSVIFHMIEGPSVSLDSNLPTASRASEGADSPDAAMERRTPIHVMVFNGDSVNRELFHRLIHLIRYGHEDAAIAKKTAIRVTKQKPMTSTDDAEEDGGRGGGMPASLAADEDDVNDDISVSFFPHYHYASHYDMVYAVYSDHDELLGFHTPQTNDSSIHTVQTYFSRLAHRLRRGALPADERALVYIVWLWDPFTTIPRPAAFGDVGVAPSASSSMVGKDVTPKQDVPLSEVGVRAPVLVQGTAFWERRQGKEVMQLLKERVEAVRSADAAAGSVRRRSVGLYLLTPNVEDLLSEKYPKYLTKRLWMGLEQGGPKTPRNVGGSWPSVATPHYNIHKNRGMMEWVVNLSRQDRSGELSDSAKQRTQPPAMLLLEKAKAQFLPEDPTHDRIHFTCRATFAFGKPMFMENSLSPWAIRRLLGFRSGLHAHPTPPPATCRSGGDVGAEWVVGCWGNCSLSTDSFAAWLSALLLQPSVKKELWSIAGGPQFQLHGPTVTGVLIPRGCLPRGYASARDGSTRRIPQVQGLGDSLDITQSAPQVYVNMDSHRSDCINNGDSLLLHVMIADHVRRSRT